MGKVHTKELLKFLMPFPDTVQERVLWLREWVWGMYPQANELIYDNYNAVAVGWSPTSKVGHAFCSIAVFRTNHNVHFGFYWGSEIADPGKILLGEGKQYRYLLVDDEKEFPKAYMKRLVKEAYVNSMAKVKDPRQIRTGETMTKSISASKRTKGKKAKKAAKKK